MCQLLYAQGILAVTLVRARGLGGWQGEADPYCTLSLMDTAGVSGGMLGGERSWRLGVLDCFGDWKNRQ